ncbi:MAG: nucleotide exchange factor GrpE [Nanoarchaeota archaeon]|nr:nucleotide exchange factor GrpE [Nanoarchaeota archaeon]
MEEGKYLKEELEKLEIEYPQEEPETEENLEEIILPEEMSKEQLLERLTTKEEELDNLYTLCTVEKTKFITLENKFTTLETKFITREKELEQELEQSYETHKKLTQEMKDIKRRREKEKEDLTKYANENLIKEILPVIDNLYQTLHHAEESKDSSSLIEGINLTLKNLISTLEEMGLEEVKSEGELFNPEYHEAMSMKKDDNFESGYVINEMQKGYTLNGRLIRAARVIISE